MNVTPEQIFLINPSNVKTPLELQKHDPDEQVNLENVEDFSNVCRTCATITDLVIPIFDGEGRQNNLAEKITTHLPIQVSDSDTLPTVVCYQCYNTLLAWHELVQCCVQADKALRTRQAVLAARRLVEEPDPGPSHDAAVDSVSYVDTKESDVIFITISKALEKYIKMLEPGEDFSNLEFVCQKCNKKMFKQPEELSTHLWIHHSHLLDSEEAVLEFIEEYITFEETLSSVGDWSDKISDGSTLQEAITQETPQRVQNDFHCPFCNNIFSTSTRWLSHVNQHAHINEDNLVICTICSEMFNNKMAFRDHMKSNHMIKKRSDNQSRCRSCGYEAEDSESLKSHIKETHEIFQPKQVKAVNRDAAHYSPAACNICERLFSNKYNLAQHMKRHSGRAEVFPCGECSKVYRSAQSLQYHRHAAHDGRLRYPCPACGELLGSAAARTAHARRHAPGPAPHRCPRCPRALRDRAALRRHLDAHLDVRNYPCPRCHKRFRKSSHLKYHLTTHDKKNEGRKAGD